MVYQRDALPSFAGILTFLRAPQADFKDLGPGLIAVLGAPHDGTLGSRQGTRFGPRGIRHGSIDQVSYILAGHEKFVTHIASGTAIRVAPNNPLVDLGDLNVFPNDLARTVESFRGGVKAVAESGATAILLGGDHYVTYPLFLGFMEGMQARGAKRLGYIQFDNHLDLSDDNKIWGKHYHGSQARRISELPAIEPRNMVWIGAAGPTPREQLDWIRANGATLFTPTDVRRIGLVNVVQQALEIAGDGTDSIYVSLDIDVVTGGASPGTGSVVLDGLSPQELFTAMSMLAESGKIGALDVTEVAPILDVSDRTIRIAANAIVELISPRVFIKTPHEVEVQRQGGTL
jgi:agmatinase